MIKYLTFLMVMLQGFGLFAQQKKVLSLSDYEKWSRITRASLSGDGNWVVHGLQPNGGDETLYLQDLRTDSISEVKYANNGVFSDNSQWVYYYINPSKAEAKKAREARRELSNTLVVKNLQTGEESKYERVNRAEFTTDGQFLAIHRRKNPDDKSRHAGSDLILLELKSKKLLNIGNVSQFSFNRIANKMAYTVDADGKVGNGLYMVDLPSMNIQVLDSDTSQYASLIWDDAQSLKSEWGSKGKTLAVLKGITDSKKTLRENSVLVLRNMGQKDFKKTEYTTQNFENFPKTFVITELGALRFSNDGSQVFIGIKEQESVLKLSKDTVANVDVWHWKDEMIQSVQIRRANMLRRQTYQSSILLDNGQFVQYGDDNFRSIAMSKNARYAIARNDRDYVTDVSWGESVSDLYRVDLKTGEKVLFAKGITRVYGSSPDGKHYLYFDNDNIHVYDVNTNKSTDISAKSGVSFLDIDHPYPNANPTYGIAGFTKDGKSVVVNHTFDLYLISLDGSKSENLTKGLGDKESIRFRYVNLDPQEEYIDTKAPILLSAYGEWTKKTGYFSVQTGQEPKQIVYEDRSYGRPLKADYANKVFYTLQSFVDFPDYYVSDLNFSSPRKVTNANPQQAEYAWGSKKLVDYTNSRGIKLQGTLTLPANYEPGKKYPMVVYFYEKMSQNHHQYSMPVYDDRPHISYYSSNGYIVLQPDNVYEEGRPGTSALDCITSAVQEVIRLGYADPDNIGLQGHSWGGYQSSFILTQTDLFKCVVTGAPPTNLEGFYNNLYGSTGTNHHGITEIGQIRMGRNVTPWSNREAYQRENPMFHADKITTPFMILHGTVDGAVDWAQGMEFYNAARRLGKEVIFLSYPGEDHHLANEANTKDFQLRMKQYFDHYLKGTEAPEWMIDGIPNLQKLYDKAK